MRFRPLSLQFRNFKYNLTGKKTDLLQATSLQKSRFPTLILISRENGGYFESLAQSRYHSWFFLAFLCACEEGLCLDSWVLWYACYVDEVIARNCDDNEWEIRMNKRSNLVFGCRNGELLILELGSYYGIYLEVRLVKFKTHGTQFVLYIGLILV